MTGLSILILMALPLMAAPASAAGADAPAEQAEFLRIFDAYNAAALRGDVDGMLSWRSAAMAEEIRGELAKDPEARAFLLGMSRGQAPEARQIEHIYWSEDGDSAEVHWLWTLPPMPEMEREQAAQIESMTRFVREEGAWKLGDILLMYEVSRIKRPTDLGYDEADIDEEMEGSLGGRITRLEFKEDHTLVLVRVMDEEVAVFLPARKVLEDAGVDFAAYAPWSLREFRGFRHRSDPLRFFATGDSPM